MITAHAMPTSDQYEIIRFAQSGRSAMQSGRFHATTLRMLINVGWLRTDGHLALPLGRDACYRYADAHRLHRVHGTPLTPEEPTDA